MRIHRISLWCMNPLQYRTRKPHKRQRNIKLRRGQYAIFMQCSFAFFNVSNHNTRNSPRNGFISNFEYSLHRTDTFFDLLLVTFVIFAYRTRRSSYLVNRPSGMFLVLRIRFDSNTAHQYLLFQQDYVKEGMLMKLCRKDMQERMFFLVIILPFFLIR